MTDLLETVDDGIVTLTLNRPERLNALSMEIRHGLLDALLEIVEKEGVLEKNMGPVARVVYNRLEKGTPLQMDSTVLYALGLDGGTVTPAMLRTPSPYNSYLNLGLTPTPICVVSATALSSMLHPPAGSWLYFVLIDKSGDMAFADTYAQQLANEARAAKAGV